MLYCIENLEGTRIYVGAHWETKPSLNSPLCFVSEEDARNYRVNVLPESHKTKVVQVKGGPCNPKMHPYTQMVTLKKRDNQYIASWSDITGQSDTLISEYRAIALRFLTDAINLRRINVPIQYYEG